MKRVVIVGERGLVSRVLAQRLDAMPDVVACVILTAQASTEEGVELMASADLVVLAVQDFASPGIVAQLPESTRILDVSPAFRTTPGWVYGLPELPGQRERIASAHRVANPGCFATAAILTLAPLTQAGLLASSTALYLDGVGGYSAGGSKMESKALAGDLPAESVYGLATEHRHIAEIKQFANLDGPVWFMPKIANFKQGIRMQIPLPGVEREAVLAAWEAAYANTAIEVDRTIPSKLAADEWARKQGACLRVVPQAGGCVAVCLMDNLGKGAVDSALDNLRLMLG